MINFVWFLLGIISGLIIAEFLPADVKQVINGKIKNKNSPNSVNEIVTEPQPKKRFKLFRRKNKVADN